jgi:hypothetical protein
MTIQKQSIPLRRKELEIELMRWEGYIRVKGGKKGKEAEIKLYCRQKSLKQKRKEAETKLLQSEKS